MSSQSKQRFWKKRAYKQRWFQIELSSINFLEYFWVSNTAHNWSYALYIGVKNITENEAIDSEEHNWNIFSSHVEVANCLVSRIWVRS